jgi:thiosulfate/3-mercaptopyruvate sulfurtransferase
MFRSFGHDQSSVLDGGLPGWEIEGLPTEAGPVMEVPRSTGKYPAPTLAPENIRSEPSIVVMSDLCGSVNTRLRADDQQCSEGAFRAPRRDCA